MATAKFKTLSEANVKQIVGALGQRDLDLKTAALSEVTQTLADYATKAQAQAMADKVKADLVGTAPATYDTLQEIAAFIESHGSEAEALTAEVAKKANSTDVYTKAQADALLAAKLEAGNIAIFTDDEITALLVEALPD